MEKIENIEGVFCDAIARKGDLTAFASLWGRSASIMSLYGGITNGTINSLIVYGQHWQIEKSLDKIQTKMPKHSKFGSDLVHVMLSSQIAQSEVMGQRILLSKDHNDVDKLNMNLWAALNQCSEIALLKSWQNPLLKGLVANELIRPLEAVNINATLLDLSNREKYENIVCDMIKTGILRDK